MSDYEIVKWEPSHIEYAKSPNIAIASDLGWSMCWNGYDEVGQLRMTRIFSIDPDGYLSCLQQWLKARKKQ